MPIKYNRTKFDNFIEHLKIVVTKESRDNAPCAVANERLLKTEAIIIASLCPSFSYLTSRGIVDENTDFNNISVKEEYAEAQKGKWKQLRNIDVQEVSGMNIKDSAFYKWLHYIVIKDEHELYKTAWISIKSKFSGACDEIEVAGRV